MKCLLAVMAYKEPRLQLWENPLFPPNFPFSGHKYFLFQGRGVCNLQREQLRSSNFILKIKVATAIFIHSSITITRTMYQRKGVDVDMLNAVKSSIIHSVQ